MIAYSILFFEKMCYNEYHFQRKSSDRLFQRGGQYDDKQQSISIAMAMAEFERISQQLYRCTGTFGVV